MVWRQINDAGNKTVAVPHDSSRDGLTYFVVRPPGWQIPSLISSCPSCNVVFDKAIGYMQLSNVPTDSSMDNSSSTDTGTQSLTLAKCHCHSCGIIFCNVCLNAKIELPSFGFPSPVSVCSSCAVWERRKQEFEGGHLPLLVSGATLNTSFDDAVAHPCQFMLSRDFRVLLWRALNSKENILAISVEDIAVISEGISSSVKNKAGDKFQFPSFNCCHVELSDDHLMSDEIAFGVSYVSETTQEDSNKRLRSVRTVKKVLMEVESVEARRRWLDALHELSFFNINADRAPAAVILLPASTSNNWQVDIDAPTTAARISNHSSTEKAPNVPAERGSSMDSSVGENNVPTLVSTGPSTPSKVREQEMEKKKFSENKMVIRTKYSV